MHKHSVNELHYYAASSTSSICCGTEQM